MIPDMCGESSLDTNGVKSEQVCCANEVKSQKVCAKQCALTAPTLLPQMVRVKIPNHRRLRLYHSTITDQQVMDSKSS